MVLEYSRKTNAEWQLIIKSYPFHRLRKCSRLGRKLGILRFKWSHQRRITREQKISCWTLLINVSKWSTEELEKPVYLAEYGKKIAQTILHIGFPSSIPPILDPILQAYSPSASTINRNKYYSSLFVAREIALFWWAGILGVLEGGERQAGGRKEEPGGGSQQL